MSTRRSIKMWTCINACWSSVANCQCFSTSPHWLRLLRRAGLSLWRVQLAVEKLLRFEWWIGVFWFILFWIRSEWVKTMVCLIYPHTYYRIHRTQLFYSNCAISSSIFQEKSSYIACTYCCIFALCKL